MAQAKEAPAANAYRNTGILVGVGLFLVLAIAYLLRPLPPQVFGALPSADIAEITTVIRQEDKTSALELLSHNIEDKAHAISGYGADHKFIIRVVSAGEVEVITGFISDEDEGLAGYELKKKPGGWEITNRRHWP